MDCEFFKSGNANFKHVDNIADKADTNCIDVVLSIVYLILNISSDNISNVEYIIVNIGHMLIMWIKLWITCG